MNHPNIIIITGRSGSGKNTAIAALEDAGFYCVDNLPVALLPEFLKLSIQESSDFAFVMDLRDKDFLTKYVQVFSDLTDKGYHLEIIYLEADENTLLQRFKQTRRPHPLATKKSLLQGIRSETKLLANLRKVANIVIDTTNCTVHELKFQILAIAQKGTELVPMIIQIISFGFKFGIPLDADLIIDIRFLKNPYFVPELRPLDGTSKRIKSFVLNNPETNLFLQKYLNLLDYLIPLYEKEGKAYLTVAVGCTGGRHRSVVIANTIGEHISKMQKQFTITHRDIGHSSK